MRVGLLSDFFMDIKNWIYNWDTVTFAIIITIVSLLMVVSAVSFVKGAFEDKTKIKFFQLIFLGLLIAMLVIILVIRY